MSAQAFRELVEAAGGQAPLARRIGISQQRISYCLAKGLSLPSEFALKAEAEFGISRHDLRPDIYPPHESPRAKAKRRVA